MIRHKSDHRFYFLNKTAQPSTWDAPAPRTVLRQLLAPGSCLIAPETPDGMLARMVALAGFDVAYVGMRGTALNRIGSADADLLTATELIDNAARCIRTSGLPTLVDAGAGFGNAMNVRRTVEDLERAGAAGILLRDHADVPAYRQVARPLAPEEMAAKLRAACDARRDSGLLVVAGLSPHAPDGAERLSRYQDAGADLIHVGVIRDRAQAEALVGGIAGQPLV
ncbi:MAG: isocitrate lyase/PEP mutase family protein, partial [Comamonadaceae bacterium]